MIVEDRLMLLYLRVWLVVRVQTFVERYSEGQVIWQFFAAEFRGVDQQRQFELRYSILEDPQIESVLVLGLGVGDDSIDEDGSREIMVEHAAVYDSLSQILNLQGKGDVSEGCMDPAKNLLP